MWPLSDHLHSLLSLAHISQTGSQRQSSRRRAETSHVYHLLSRRAVTHHSHLQTFSVQIHSAHSGMGFSFILCTIVCTHELHLHLQGVHVNIYYNLCKMEKNLWSSRACLPNSVHGFWCQSYHSTHNNHRRCQTYNMSITLILIIFALSWLIKPFQLSFLSPRVKWVVLQLQLL